MAHLAIFVSYGPCNVTYRFAYYVWVKWYTLWYMMIAFQIKLASVTGVLWHILKHDYYALVGPHATWFLPTG